MSTRQAAPILLKYVTFSRASGYRDLALRLVDEAGREYRLFLPPNDVQSLIFACAEAAQQIGTRPPIDWDAYPATITWPTITPWKAGATAPTVLP